MSYRQVISGQASKYLDRFDGNNSGNAPVLLMLGGFKFSINTAAFTQMQRSSAWQWPAQARIGQRSALQFIGPGDDTLVLPGVVYSDFRGGSYQLDALRRMAAMGQPLPLLNAHGRVLGNWVIDKIDETASEFHADGTPRKQEFSISLRRFDDADV